MASPLPSPRRLSHASQAFPGPSGPSSPRARHIPSRLPSVTSQALDFDFDSPEHRDGPSPITSSARTTIHGFSPSGPSSPLPSVAEFPRSPQLPAPLNTRLPLLSPQITTPIEQTFQYPYPDTSSPRPLPASPRQYEFPPRSRRNSAAIVSISLSSRSRSRTPRGTSAALPGGSGQATPSKNDATITPRGEDGAVGGGVVMVQMKDVGSPPSAPGVDDIEDWQPAGGILLGDECVIEDDLDVEPVKSWTGTTDERDVEDVLSPGMLFGEGLEFQGETIRPAVGKGNGSGDDAGLPLRRGGSEVGQAVRGQMRGKKVYQVVRQLGSGSYAVVYLVREKGGRRREYGEQKLLNACPCREQDVR